MHILVTGGAGYIGSVVVEELARAGDRVTVVDDLRKGHRAAVADGVSLHTFDVMDTQRLDALFAAQQFDGVIHLAAYSLVGESVAQPARYYANNVAATLALLDTMARYGVKRFVFSSTAAVYGQPDQALITEDAPLQPTNPYGQTKLAIEQALPWYEQAYGLRYASLRYFNAAGATARCGEHHDPETHLIPLLLNVAMGKAPEAQIFGTDYPTPDGSCIRDYIHVADLARAHVLAARALDDASHIFNLGNGAGFSVLEVLAAARAVTGHPIPAVAYPRRPGDPPCLVAASDRIRRDLGWRPEIPDIRAIIHTAWDWAQRHPNGYPD